MDRKEQPKVWLLEFDKRFEVFEEFVFYDFNEPMKLPRKSDFYCMLSTVLEGMADNGGMDDGIGLRGISGA